MNLLDLTLPTAAENVALDEALLLDAESGAGGEVLRLWEFPAAAVVLGAAGVLADDVDEANCRADGVPVAIDSSCNAGRLGTGGGTIYLWTDSRDYAITLAPLGGVRVHVWDPAAGAWTS